MKVPALPSAIIESPGVRLSLLGATLVIGGASVGAVLYTIEPRLLVLLMVVPAGVLALRAAFIFPGFLFGLFLCTPFYKAGLQGFSPVDVTVVLAILNALQIPIVFFLNKDRSLEMLRHRYARWAIVAWSTLTIVIVAGVLRAPDRDASMTAAIDWVVLTFIPAFAAIRVVSDHRYIRQFLLSLILVGAAVVVAGLWLLPQVGAWPNDRLRVFGAHTIRVGQAAVLIPLVVIPCAFKRALGPLKLLYLGLIPASLLVAASSGSRGPLLMLVVTGVVFSVRRLILWVRGLKSQGASVRPFRILIPVFLFMLMLVAPIEQVTRLIPETSFQRLGTLSAILGGIGGGEELTSEAPDASTADRVIAYGVAERMFFDQPLFGLGTRSFPTEVARHEIRLIWPEATAHPHNLLLQMAAEQGVIGIAVLSLLLATAFWRGMRLGANPEWSTLSILCFFFLLCSMVSTDLLENRMLWILLFMLMLAPGPDTGGSQTNLAHKGSSSKPTSRAFRSTL